MNATSTRLLLLFVGACVSEPSVPSGNAELGIASFAISETADSTHVIGLDADDEEIARLDLIHGRFVSEEYGGEVDGRQLGVFALGQDMKWETAGYAPFLNLPAPPATHRAVTTFLADPHVAPILERWQIGWQVGAREESAYHAATTTGTFIMNCSGLADCGALTRMVGTSPLVLTINTCGGGALASSAIRINESVEPNRDTVAQCCPAGAGGNASPWYSTKQCPTTEDTYTECGELSPGVACKGCPVVNAAAYCSVTYDLTQSRIEAAFGDAYLTTGQTCQSPNLWYGPCAAGLVCLDAARLSCNAGEICTCVADGGGGGGSGSGNRMVELQPREGD